MSITQEELKDAFEYNPDTGLFIRRHSGGGEAGGSIAGTMIGAGYILIGYDYARYYAHRLAIVYMDGLDYAGDWEVDHVNHVPSDNRYKNLRVVTHRENGKNMRRSKANTSGVTGVSWHKQMKKWTVRIYDGKKYHSLGLYDDFTEAVRVRKAAEILLGFHENHGKGD